eukprot:g7310.t1
MGDVDNEDEPFPSYTQLDWNLIKARIPKSVESPLQAGQIPGKMTPKELYLRIEALFPELADMGKDDDEKAEQARIKWWMKKLEWHANAMETYVPMHTLPAGQRPVVPNRYRAERLANEQPMRVRDRTDRQEQLLRAVPYQHEAPGRFTSAQLRSPGARCSRPTFDTVPKANRHWRRLDPYALGAGPMNSSAASAEHIQQLCAQARARTVPHDGSLVVDTAGGGVGHGGGSGTTGRAIVTVLCVDVSVLC